MKINWDAALVPPETIEVGGANVRWHPCLLLEASPHDGPAPIGGLTAPVQGNNNIAQRNITITYTDEDFAAFTGMIVGSRAKGGVATLVLDPRRLDGLKVIRLHLADERVMKRLQASAERLSRQVLDRDPDFHEGKFTLVDRARLRFGTGRFSTILEAAAGTTIATIPQRRSKFDVSFGSFEGISVIEISDLRDEIELPLDLDTGQFVPLCVSVDGEPAGDLRITQRRGDGELSGGYGIRYGAAR